MNGEAATQQRPELPLRLPVPYAAFTGRHREIYYRYAYSRLGSANEAREAVNDLFVKLFLRWQEALRSENINAFAWRMLHDHVVDELRRRDRRPAPVDTAFLPLSSPMWAEQADPIEALLVRIDLYRALDALPPRQRQCFWLRHVLGYKATEVAETMGLTPSTVRTHLQHAAEHLSHALQLDEHPAIAAPRKAC